MAEIASREQIADLDHSLRNATLTIRTLEGENADLREANASARDALVALVADLRALHAPDEGGYCEECLAPWGPRAVRHPCATVRIIDRHAGAES